MWVACLVRAVLVFTMVSSFSTLGILAQILAVLMPILIDLLIDFSVSQQGETLDMDL